MKTPGSVDALPGRHRNWKSDAEPASPSDPPGWVSSDARPSSTLSSRCNWVTTCPECGALGDDETFAHRATCSQATHVEMRRSTRSMRAAISPANWSRRPCHAHSSLGVELGLEELGPAVVCCSPPTGQCGRQSAVVLEPTGSCYPRRAGEGHRGTVAAKGGPRSCLPGRPDLGGGRGRGAIRGCPLRRNL